MFHLSLQEKIQRVCTDTTGGTESSRNHFVGRGQGGSSNRDKSEKRVSEYRLWDLECGISTHKITKTQPRRPHGTPRYLISTKFQIKPVVMLPGGAFPDCRFHIPKLSYEQGSRKLIFRPHLCLVGCPPFEQVQQPPPRCRPSRDCTCCTHDPVEVYPLGQWSGGSKREHQRRSTVVLRQGQHNMGSRSTVVPPKGLRGCATPRTGGDKCHDPDHKT